MSDREPAPPLDYQPAPCPRCGARTFTAAETQCMPGQDVSGDYWCPVSDQEPGADDLVRQPTAESIALLDEWCMRDIARMEREAEEGGA